MNILVAASRGGGLQERVKDFTLYSEVIPGGKIAMLTSKALSMLPSPHQTVGTTHVYIMGGIPDITQKLKTQHPRNHPTYTECIYTDPIPSTISKIKHEIDKCAKKILDKGAKPCFCTITSCDIAKYNRNLLQRRKTHTLHYTQQYTSMQTNLETALEDINKYILETNRKHNMSTPFCHTVIRKRKGKSPKHYYKHQYDLLWDGVHGNQETRDKWGRAIEGAIRNNRGKRNHSDSEEENKSPKRSWRGEKGRAVNTSSR